MHKNNYTHFSSWDLKFTWMLHTYSDTICALIIWLLIKFCALLTGCYWLQMNKQGTVVFIFAGSEFVYDFYLSGIYRIKCVVIIVALQVKWKKHSDYSDSFSPAEFWCTMNSMYVTCVTCLWTRGDHLEHLVWMW